MSFYRSDSVSGFRLYLQRETAWQTMHRLGQERLIHVVPQQHASSGRPFLQQVRRCDLTLQKTAHIEHMLKEKEIYQPKNDFPPQAYQELYQSWRKQVEQQNAHPSIILERAIEDSEQETVYFNNLTRRQDGLVKKRELYRNNLAVLEAGEMKFGQEFFRHPERRQDNSMGPEDKKVVVNYLCGVITKEEELRFKKSVFLVSKGNSMLTTVDFTEIFNEDDLPAQARSKVVFYILYPGRKGRVLDRKLIKLMDVFSEHQYELPSTPLEFLPVRDKFRLLLSDTNQMVRVNEETLRRSLIQLIRPQSNSEYFNRYEQRKLLLIKERMIYQNLNYMQVHKNVMLGDVYVRDDDIERLHEVLREVEGQQSMPVGQLIPKAQCNPPTHFSTNDFTRSAQVIVQTYGVADYKEANPAFFTVITFPFMYGVMFGDFAHGMIIFAIGLSLVFFKDSLRDTMMKPFIPHRYLLALMGFFSIYCGLIYNDTTSMSLNYFGSCYSHIAHNVGQVIARNSKDCVYALGLDPVWAQTHDDLNFENSLKMKLSVIIGVLHMTLGVLMKGTNCIFRRNYIDFFFQFLPQLIFMIVLFGYMDFLIVFKWLHPWDEQTPPSIITTLINLPMKFGATTNCCGGEPMWGVPGETSQDMIQKIFVLIAVFCVPMMLIPKPLYLILSRKEEEHHRIPSEEPRMQEEIQNDDDSKPHRDEHGPGEIIVHQMIETIEYVLGCVSNTASYLRLWALSLAHTELSEVFFDYMIKPGVSGSGSQAVITNILGFIMHAAITFGVLLCMDSLECFLHTLRLHWVEFQSKFYRGTGYSFIFFNFQDKINTSIETS